MTLLNSTLHLSLAFKYTPVVAVEMSPAWFLSIFNAMLTDTIAGSIAPSQPPPQRMPIIVAGIGYQGLGWTASVLLLAWFIGQLLEKGWPEPSQRPGLFMSIGSAGFTTVALIGTARAEILQVLATWAGIFLWGFALWLFGLAFFVCMAEVITRENGLWVIPMRFTNTWWAFIFPNVGFTLATVYLGQELESNAILWFSVDNFDVNLCRLSNSP
ncbi:hypothetical protein N7516_007276 [Penicillium verrucosum]|uniref:uncharacterized protein n=1 Tax=Penicillium verrucosum TaxID=60171 RepID=UPI0025450EC1|nr:uncharacterized protein N7516_007276 [Penicillium verrucosum]KAJ5932787.1 hypothetical protein N7516_007276 [Penicillium verrucosum]